MKTNIPKLRFVEFKDDPAWEEKKLGEILLFLKDGTHDTHPNDENSEYKLLSAKNIYNNSINIFEDDRSISQVEYDSIFKNYKLEKNDILLTIVGTIGRTALYNCEEKIAFQRSVAFIRTSENQYFINHILDNTTTKNQLDKFTSISAQPGVYLSDLKKLKLSLPGSSEQEKIGKFLSTLDKRIELQEKLIEKLEEEKKGNLQKLFPKKGNNIPELRFDEFKNGGEWIENLLGETTTITMGQSPNSSAYTDDINATILIQGNADLKNGYVVPRVYTKNITKLCEINDIIMTVRAPVGDLAISKYKACIGRGVCSIKGDLFTYYALKMLDSRGYWKALSTGTTISSIKSDDVKELRLSYPSVLEQEKIGLYLDKIKTRIEIHEELCCILKSKKDSTLSLVIC